MIPAAPPPDANQSHFSGAAAGRDADTHCFAQGTSQRTAGATSGMAAAAAVQHGLAATAQHRRFLGSASQPVVSAPRAKRRCRQTPQRTSWGPCHFSAKDSNRVATAVAGSKRHRSSVDQSQPSYAVCHASSLPLPFPQGRHVPAPPLGRVSSRGTNRVEGGPVPLP